MSTPNKNRKKRPLRSPVELLASVKLVVWDLDNTLWHGTLDDGDEPIPTDLAAWLSVLADAGIISSICSTNDFTAASQAMTTVGFDSLVVSPRIGWGPKSALVSALLTDLGVRPEDALFVDDTARIRDEVATICGVHSIAPDDLRPVNLDALHATDPQRTRLAHYRSLAARVTAHTATRDRGLETFLARSCIRAAIESASDHADRISELSRRANQRNLTTSRLTADEVRALASDPDITTGCVFVGDRFGDSGLVGFFAIEAATGKAQHFFFSCRVMNLGLEEWVCAFVRLHDSAVTTQLNSHWVESGVSWIDADPDRVAPLALSDGVNLESDVLWIGGCDVQAIEPYVPPELRRRSEWQVLDTSGEVQQYAHSSLLVLDAILGGDIELLDGIPWLSHWSAEVREPHVATVLSLWVDYACLTIRHRSSGVRLPSYLHLSASSSEFDWKHWWGGSEGREQFLAEFEPAPALTPHEVEDLLATVTDRLRPGSLVLLNAPDFPRSEEYADRTNQSDRNRAVNQAVDRVVATHPSLQLVDVREVVVAETDLDHPNAVLIFHYNRQVYYNLARALSDRVNTLLGRSSIPPR